MRRSRRCTVVRVQAGTVRANVNERHVTVLAPTAARLRFPELQDREDVALAFELAGCPGGIAIVDDRFDSDVFERRIGRVLDVGAPQAATRAALLEAIAQSATSEGFDQLLRRTPAGERVEAWALGRAGFELMDIGVVFARSVVDLASAIVRPDIAVRVATDEDIADIASGMLEQPWGSRYESDPTYTLQQVRELRRRWLWNSHRGRADIVLVGEIDGRVGAYATCVLDAHTRRGDVELVGTLPAFRGRGAAAHLVAHAIAWFSTRADAATVRTQATNTVAVRVYERAGFTLDSCDTTYRISLGDTRTAL